VTAVVVTSAPVAPEELIAFARGRLAGHKVPKAVHFVDVLPKNASGKLLKRELREELANRPEGDSLGENRPESDSPASSEFDQPRHA
jgi:fatty-acyl-CoA synthase